MFPVLKRKILFKVIEKLGFFLDRQKGSHAIYKNNHENRVVVPIHSGKNLK
ncbi:MAG: type II toxin-antitoxin system HicA family toxin [Crocosphaera sp.]